MKYLFPFLLLIILTGCLPKQDDVRRVFQTNAAIIIEKDYKDLTKDLITLKTKLDKRNPKAYDQSLSPAIYTQLDNLDDQLHLSYNGVKLNSYKEYLQLAFSKNDLQNRNDYLILGLYYMIHNAFDIKDGNQITALAYEHEKVKNLYHNLQIVRWRLKYAKDLNDEYLFLTWQNNWQIELERRVKNGAEPSWQELQELHYIKNGQESLFSPSNLSFEVTLTRMIDRSNNALKLLGVEVKDMSLEAIKTVFLFL